LDDIFVLFLFERARGINQTPAGAQMLKRLAHESYLLGVKVGQVDRLETPLDFGIASDGASSGARRIDENAIEFGPERQWLGAIQDDQRAVEIAHLFQAVQVNVARDSSGSLLDGLRGLVAGRGTQIEERLAGMQIEQRHDGLRANVLDAASARDVVLRRAEKRGSDLIGCRAAELAIPSFQQPGGHGKFGGAIGPRDRRAIRLSQNRVHQACCRRSAKTLHQLDAFADRGVRGDPIEIAQLVNAHAERDADFEFRLTWDAAGDEVIELGLVAEASVDNFRSQARVAGVELRGALEQKVGGITALVHFSEDVEGNLARGGDQVLF